MATQQSAEDLGHQLEAMLDIERFEPPEDFVRNSLIKDRSIYDRAAQDPEAFWLEQAKELLTWSKEPTRSLNEDDAPFYKWFEDGELNACFNCLDRHVEAGRGDRVAIHWHGEEGEERDITYADLLHDTQRFANALKSHGIGKGDVVGVYLGMIPEVLVAMLACARIGAMHNVVFGGFSAEAVRERMAFSDAKALVTADGARRKGRTAEIKAVVDEEMGGMPTVKTVFVVRSTGIDCPMTDGRDVFYDEELGKASADCPCEPMAAEDPLYILYSSGSTGSPKGVLHTTGGYMMWAALTHKYIFDIRPESDVYWCCADVGWVTGHTYILYAPLTNCMTSVMYEGAPDHPDKDIWWALCERYKVTQFYTAPTAIRACIKWGAEYPQRHDLSSLRLLGTVGEPINPKAWLWYHKVIGGERCPIVDTWWQTETGGAMITPLPSVVATKPGSATLPFPGIEPAVYDDDGNEVSDRQGYLVIKRPWPGMLRTLYRDDERFVETYFTKYGRETYFVADAARKDDDGYFWVIGRVDDVLNVSGHRLSTAEIESAIVSYEKVAEAAVIGQQDDDTGQAVCAFVTLESGTDGDDALIGEIREHVAGRIGKFARPKRVVWADDLPKTRSGKIMRRLLRDIAEGRALGDVTTLRDPTVTEMIAEKVRAGEE